MIKKLENKVIDSFKENGRLSYGMSHMLIGGSLACISTYQDTNYLEYFAIGEMFYGLYQIFKAAKEY